MTIAGIPCAVSSVDYAAGLVRCVTGTYGRTSLAARGIGWVVVNVAGVGDTAATSDALYEYVDLWSRLTTWGGTSLPVAGDSIWIQPGQTCARLQA